MSFWDMVGWVVSFSPFFIEGHIHTLDTNSKSIFEQFLGSVWLVLNTLNRAPIVWCMVTVLHSSVLGMVFATSGVNRITQRVHPSLTRQSSRNGWVFLTLLSSRFFFFDTRTHYSLRSLFYEQLTTNQLLLLDGRNQHSRDGSHGLSHIFKLSRDR